MNTTIKISAAITMSAALFFSASKIDDAIQNQVDQIAIQVSEGASDFKQVVVIDHSRLAQKAGVEMTPSIVNIFSNPKVNTALLQEDILVGLDLPYKVLSYAEPSQDAPNVAYADAEFIKKRYEIESKSLKEYDKDLEKVTKHISKDIISKVNTDAVNKHYGIIKINSKYSYEETINKLKEAVLAQGDTQWFSEIDFQKDAQERGISLTESKLLLFGGPAPGGKAMGQFPKLGLDAFCQKVLVYVDDQGNTNIAFNDIEAFSLLHYGKSALPHKVINGRLVNTFTKAIAE
ncbi:DUF302 domain-containing protein [Flammeovirga sp. SubArs3]|uniref:DUF302 domain-containing protein n=1 Tax=Flammeovirga sp. SubArs3 TaxID=2995316 RepID=UPI00248B59EB|nr:DUF302 domain-containing protein [Flammeovirga sp. SubArs3]